MTRVRGTALIHSRHCSQCTFVKNNSFIYTTRYIYTQLIYLHTTNVSTHIVIRRLLTISRKKASPVNWWVCQCVPRPIDSTNTSLAGQRGIEPGRGYSRVNTGHCWSSITCSEGRVGRTICQHRETIENISSCLLFRKFIYKKKGIGGSL